MAFASSPPPKSPCSAKASLFGCSSPDQSLSTNYQSAKVLSTFECIFSSYPPVFESLLLNLPTSSLISLYHTSNCLRSFLQQYPTAWNHISFRTHSSAQIAPRHVSPAGASAVFSTTPVSKSHSVDLLLLNIVLPFGTRLKSLDLDHTTVDGGNLATSILHGRRETLQHLSVRGCKQVSLKYHIVPFLTLFGLQKVGVGAVESPQLALKSLYTFRCRHHRRRPYTPASCVRKDSDSASIHDLINLCHDLGIWTDTAWCTTPGGRCFTRRDYHARRNIGDTRNEIWVPFDRLWRSKNRLGPPREGDESMRTGTRGQKWETLESGYDGEPLGCGSKSRQGEGKGVSAHLRHSHKTFIENVHCHNCQIPIPERCEQCSISMHCMGCRKTLCENCAFSQPVPRVSILDKAKLCDQNLWWAPNCRRTPNLMISESITSTNIGSPWQTTTFAPPIKLQWCCHTPSFTNCGRLNSIGPETSKWTVNQLRAIPLPKGYEDPEFLRLKSLADSSKPQPPSVLPSDTQQTKGHSLLLQRLLGSKDHNPCPRNLCQECFETPGWRASCSSCKEPLCFAHDFRSLKVRVCGYKDLATEKAWLNEISKLKDVIKWSLGQSWQEVRRDGQSELVSRKCLETHGLTSHAFSILESVIPLIKAPVFGRNKLAEEIDAFPSRGLPYTPIISSDRIPDCSESGTIMPLSPHENNEAPQIQASGWQGCSSFLCQERRSIGDQRRQCPAIAKQCILCRVHVCPECLVLRPACDCTYCKDHYQCPNCFDIEQCKKAEEEENKRKCELKLQQQKAEEARQLQEADSAAESVGEFFTSVFAEHS